MDQVRVQTILAAHVLANKNIKKKKNIYFMHNWMYADIHNRKL